MVVRTKRAYDPPSADDGRRYLVDRLWPRGRTAAQLRLVAWRRDLAPSAELFRAYAHVPTRFGEFRRAYRAELRAHPELLRSILAGARAGTVTLVFAARDAERSNVAVLAEFLDEQLQGRRGSDPVGRLTHSLRETLGPRARSPTKGRGARPRKERRPEERAGRPAPHDVRGSAGKR